ncbi:MAG: peptide chain release factor N(5)-glutamine methyltransferase [Sandaracinaceae bacterium]
MDEAASDREWTVRRILSWTTEDFARRGLDSPRLDAELLVARATGGDRMRLYLDLDRVLDADERARLRALVVRRRRREPIAYILGEREFWGRTFQVGPAVLIPRPDSETLIERALALVPEGFEGRALDLCTGSGALGLTLAAERPGLRVDLTDVSPDALAMAAANAVALGVRDRVRLLEGDLFGPLEEGDDLYALVLCNPPYIRRPDMARLAPEVRDHEPELALVAGADGLEVHRRLAAGLAAVLTPGGVALIEVGAGQAADAEALYRHARGLSACPRLVDLGGRERGLEVHREGPHPWGRSAEIAIAYLCPARDAPPDAAPLVQAADRDAEVPRVVRGSGAPVTPVEEATSLLVRDGDDEVDVLVVTGPRAADRLLSREALDALHQRLGTPLLAIGVPGADVLLAADALLLEGRVEALAAEVDRRVEGEPGGGLSRLLFAVREGRVVGVLTPPVPNQDPEPG